MMLSGAADAQQAGTLDHSFDNDGKVTASIGTASSLGKSIAIQADGRIVIAGYATGNQNDFSLARYMPGGSPDLSFNGTGVLLTDFNQAGDFANGVAYNPLNGKIYTGGYTENGNGFDLALSACNSDGTPDNGFGSGGKVITSMGTTAFGKAIALQADGKILLAGYSLQAAFNHFTVVRYLDNGTPDSTFGGDGIVTTLIGQGSGVANCLVIQPDGKIVLAGQFFNAATLHPEAAIVRYNPDGTPDSTFNGNGILIIPGVNIDLNFYAVAIQADGKIVAGGYAGISPSTNNFMIARFLTDGAPDSTFGVNGMLVSPFGTQGSEVTSLLIQPDGKIIAGGYSLNGNSDEFALARFDAAGNPDNSFGTAGKTNTVFGTNDGIYAMALQTDGKIVAAGTTFMTGGFDLAIARYHSGMSTGIIHQDFHGTGLIAYPNPVTDQVKLSYVLQKTESISIQLTDVHGRFVSELFNGSLTEGAHSQMFSLPASLAGGTYYIRLTYSGVASTVKIVK